MHQAFKAGLMQYGMMKAVKKIPPPAEAVAEEEHTEGLQDNEASEQQQTATGEAGDEEPKSPTIIP